ncbi:DNA replication protein DciA [Nesterenkonia halophila]
MTPSSAEHPEVEPSPDGISAAEAEDAAGLLLARMRRAAESRGEHRMRGMPRKGSLSGDPRAGSRRGSSATGRPGSGTNRRDPSLLGSVVDGLISTRGWTSPVAVGSVIARWEQLVGPEVAAHCTPERFEDGVVDVVCDSTAWATNLKLMQPQLMEVFTRELGRGIVTGLRIRGPQAPSWKKGRFSVRGPGPRDTYG